jgi:hypothetical protein
MPCVVQARGPLRGPWRAAWAARARRMARAARSRGAGGARARTVGPPGGPRGGPAAGRAPRLLKAQPPRAPPAPPTPHPDALRQGAAGRAARLARGAHAPPLLAAPRAPGEAPVEAAAAEAQAEHGCWRGAVAAGEPICRPGDNGRGRTGWLVSGARGRGRGRGCGFDARGRAGTAHRGAARRTAARAASPATQRVPPARCAHVRAVVAARERLVGRPNTGGSQWGRCGGAAVSMRGRRGAGGGGAGGGGGAAGPWGGPAPPPPPPPPLPPPLACQASGVPAWRRGSPRAPPASQCRNTSGPSSGAAGRDGAARAADRSGRPMHVCGGGGLGAGRASGPARAPGAAAAEGCAAGTPRGRGAGAAARGGRGEVGAGAPGGCMGMTTRGSVGPRVLTAAPCVSRRRAAAPRRGSAGGGRVAARAGGARAGAGAAGGRHAQRTRAGKLGLCPPRPAPPRRHAAEPPAPRCGPAIKESLTNPPRGLSASQTRAHAATHAPAATGKAPPGDREHVRAGGPATTDCGV